MAFNKVLDEMSLGLVEENEEIRGVTDRNYWETQKGAPKSVKVVDEILDLIIEVFLGYQLKYTKFYIGLAQNGRASNFVIFHAKNNFTRMGIRLEQSKDLLNEIENRGIDLMDYERISGRYRLKIAPNHLKKHRNFIKDFVRTSKGILTDTEKNEE